MSAPEGNWRLDKLVVTDLLGFQGTKEFAFQGGLQVFEAPNHSGKTSLTMALLWGLTGVVPNLARLNRQSFRLTN
jgi:DNA repair exonuclease SbcCD ATPase subunit